MTNLYGIPVYHQTKKEGVNMKTEVKSKIDHAIEELARDADIIALVKSIEGKLATTRGHYGDYMSVLGQWGNDSVVMLDIVSKALIMAGADAYGVNWAKRILSGGE
jgi:RNA binding exosome subunit